MTGGAFVTREGHYPARHGQRLGGTVTVATADMQDMTDTELLAAFRTDEHAAAARTEAARRDQADKAARERETIRAEWRDAAYADYLAAAASMTCKSTMFSAEGMANGPADEFGLWSGREDLARRWASPELCEWWDEHPRLTISRYVEQRAAAQRAAREDTAKEARSMDTASEAATAARTAADYDRHMAAGREAAERRLAAGNAGVEISGAVVRKPATPPIRAAGDIPGDQLLDLLPAALDAVTLWIAHSHMRDEKGTLIFRATPRLYLLSSEPGSGKSKVLELCNMLCPATYGLTLEPTAAGLTHTIGNEHATVFIDEGDVMFGAGQRKSAVRAVINGGYERHGTMLNGKGSKATRVPVFGALALAGLDVLEKGTGDTLTALLSRGVRIRMKKAGKDDRPAKVTRVTEDQGAKMRDWLEAWASQVLDGIKDYQPEMPEEVDGRAEQIWEPLVAVADAAHQDAVARAEQDGTPLPEDDGWAGRARAACVELALDQATAPAEEDESTAEAFASFATSLGGALADTTPDYGDDGEV
jgi:hypothetical protein